MRFVYFEYLKKNETFWTNPTETTPQMFVPYICWAQPGPLITELADVLAFSAAKPSTGSVIVNCGYVVNNQNVFTKLPTRYCGTWRLTLEVLRPEYYSRSGGYQPTSIALIASFSNNIKTVVTYWIWLHIGQIDIFSAVMWRLWPSFTKCFNFNPSMDN